VPEHVSTGRKIPTCRMLASQTRALFAAQLSTNRPEENGQLQQ